MLERCDVELLVKSKLACCFFCTLSRHRSIAHCLWLFTFILVHKFDARCVVCFIIFELPLDSVVLWRLSIR